MSDNVCPRCKKPINGKCIEGLGKKWHPEHFICGLEGCGKDMAGQFYPGTDGFPYCKKHHFQKLGMSCAECGGPIDGGCITLGEKKFHMEHFRCVCCKINLYGPRYKKQGNVPYCQPCFATEFDEVL